MANQPPSAVRIYFKALGKHWWALMSCAVFTFLGMVILAFNVTNQWALRATFAAAVLMLVFASYMAWRDEYQARMSAERKVNDFQTGSSSAQTEATTTHWEHIRYRFENLMNKGITARITEEQNGHSYAISGGSQNDRLEAETLCRNAGALLMKSRAVRDSMSDRLRQQTDDVKRWMLWIVDNHSIQASATGEDSDGNEWQGWRIDDLIRSCSIACTQYWSSVSNAG